MGLFARIPYQQAEHLMDNWPSHRWYKRSIHFLLNHNKENYNNISRVPLNENLLKSVKKHGYASPFLVLDTWYPICGSQRLRVAMEMPEKWQKKTEVWVCRFDKAAYKPLFFWPDKREGHEAVQRYFQMCEVVFKTLYMPSHDGSGVLLQQFEEEGNLLHWPSRDGEFGDGTRFGAPTNIGQPLKTKKKMVIPSL